MIAIGSDHAGFDLKQKVIEHLKELGLEWKDYGTYTAGSCDYPVFGEAVARAVASGEARRGIVICGTGAGISIVANKVRGIRAAVCSDCYSVELTRRHNDANILALGARVTGDALAMRIVDIFLTTPYEGGRHARRLALIDDLEARERA
ncbi:MAG: ribose 5-phosphate isomerase B [Oscillospiraceae bacterium]|nr:ribose 5-phosphate isomerase B [Oscillospiraceae bacterium]